MSVNLTTRQDRRRSADNPWPALWAMLVGFFMILVDATIVAVANPSIMAKLGASYDAVIWVTSAYLLAYAVPLLVSGRLGDRFGPKNLYLAGLTVFTAASLWCGLADSIETLIAARVVQGIGAAMLTPQTLSTITRIFPAERRGVAMSLWGATAGVATLVGPLAGGVLVDGLGWQWIFFVNVPVGIVGLALAVWLVPAMPTQKHRFDLIGVALSGTGMFTIVFALQEGQSHDWAPWVWGTVAGGIGFIAAFFIWQSVNPNEPLVPLSIFRDRDFSLSNIGVATIGFVVTAMMVPTMFYAQAVCGLSPARSAILIAPMAIASGTLAPFVGRIVDRSHPRPVIGFGFSVTAAAMTWLSIEMTPTTPIWRLVLPLTAVGVGMAFVWSPLAATATRNLPPQLAGAGSGVYNTTRQVGSVLGSAGIAAFMTWRISAEMPPVALEAPEGDGAVSVLPSWLHEPFSAAMSQTMLLPAFFALFGVVAALYLLGFGDRSAAAVDDYDAADVDARYAVEYGGDETFTDDDEYVEYTVAWDDAEPVLAKVVAAEAVTEPITSAAQREPEPQHADEPAPRYADEPVPPQADEPEEDPESWRSILDALLADVPPAPPKPSAEPIGFAHNGFHVDDRKLFQSVDHPDPLAEPGSSLAEAYTADVLSGDHSGGARSRHHRNGDHVRPSRHRVRDQQQEPRPFWFESNGRHARDDADDVPRSGRHSMPWRD